MQSNYLTLEERRKNPPKDLQQTEALNEMLTDFDRLNPIHVAGTKGKGTTCAFVNSILMKYHDRCGLPKRVGMYTSPHLLSVCERIRIDSNPISEDTFTKYFFEVWDALEIGAKRRGADARQKSAYFRYLTLLSFHIFVRERVDVAIYEAGVGGQFDSTNVIANPTATGITSLGIDHVQMLGNTIEEIGWHKAGIMKTGTPAYTVWQPESAMQVLKQRAEERETALSEVPIGACLQDIPIELNVDFQKRNASLAVVLAARTFTLLYASDQDNKGLQQILPVEWDDGKTIELDKPLPELFKIGLTNTVWRGRGGTVERDYGRWL